MALLDLLTGNISQFDYFNENDISLIYCPFPKKVYGVIFRYKCKNIIAINKCISTYKQKKTIIHELAHLELSHIDKRKQLMEFSIENIEDEADRYIEFLGGNNDKN